MMMMLNEHKERVSREWMKESSENYSNWISFASTPTEKHEIRERRLNFCSFWCALLFQLVEEGKFRHTKKTVKLNWTFSWKSLKNLRRVEHTMSNEHERIHFEFVLKIFFMFIWEFVEEMKAKLQRQHKKSTENNILFEKWDLSPLVFSWRNNLRVF